MAAHEAVFSWAQRLKNLCLKVYSACGQDWQKTISTKLASLVCINGQLSSVLQCKTHYLSDVGRTVCLYDQKTVFSWLLEKKAETWMTFRRPSRQWNSSFAAPQWKGCIIRIWKLSLLWRTRKVIKPSWKSVRKWLFTTLENLAVAKRLINLSDKCFSYFQRHHSETQCMVVVEGDLRTLVPASKLKVFLVLETIACLGGK